MKFLARLFARRPAAPAEAAPADAPALSAQDFQKKMGRCELTGLPNRACVEHLLEQQLDSARLMETKLSVLVLAIDGYEPPRYGAPSLVDQVRIGEVASRLRAALNRPYDVAGSLAPGRFVVLLPFTDLAGAATVARAIQKAVGFPPPPPPTTPSALRKQADGPDDAGEQAAEDAVAAPTESAGDPFAEPDALAPEPAAVQEATAPEFTLSVGVTGYRGVGQAEAAALLRTADEACDMARLDGGDRIIRRDPNWSPSAPAVQLTDAL